MWQGDATFWSGRNPILFPMVGNTFNKKQVIQGKEYTMGNHGFARSAEFDVVDVTDDSVTLLLASTTETLEQYPFEFNLYVTYKLIEKKVEISYSIINESNKDMPFNFGLHPAFKCPVEENEKFEDYRIEFSNKETLHGMYGPLGLHNEKIIPCDYSLYETNPTICFEYPQSSSVTLTNGIHGVKVNLVGYRWLAFWTKPNAPYVCIEPWHSHGDLEELPQAFEQREGTLILKPNRSYTTAYSIEIY